MKNILSNKKINLYILVGIIFLLTFGATYAYFSVTTDLNSNINTIVTETGTLGLTYVDGDTINEENIYPGFQVSKTIIVTNTGTLDAYYKIFWKNLTNNFELDELVISAVCTSYENYNTSSQVISGNCEDIQEQPIANVASSIKENIGIEVGLTHVYYFTFKFKETGSAQNYNQGKSFSGVINIDDSYGLYTMNGTLLDNNGNPLVNTIVSLNNGKSATTNNEGKFVIEDLDEGNYSINVNSVTSNLTLETGRELGSSGSTITSNIENREINVTMQLGDNTISYDVTEATEYDLNVLALYVDGVKVESLDNNKLYTLSTYTCSNGETLTWNNINKRISIDPITSATKCTVNFNKRPYFTLYEQILEDNNETSDELIDFSQVSSASNGQGLYYTSDLTKTEGGERVYYYRGAVTNNYIQFAGFCWKIVRTNENGSVKLMYWGLQNGTTCSTTATSPTSLTGKAFNSTTSDNRYVGYMYGTSCSNYSSCHTNTTNSTIKGLIDDWYNANITSEYRSKIANALYCNDRSMGNAGTISSVSYGKYGYETKATLYGATRRIGTGGITGTSFSSANASPQYNCPNDESDAFTLKVVSGGTLGYGNNALDYPVGLLTADEVAYAGGIYLGGTNNTYFLYTGSSYWVMSPFYFGNSYSSEWNVSPSGRLVNSASNGTLETFPVVSLNSSALVSTGDGHASTPYVIQ